MKLLRLTIAGFGSLRGEHRFDPDKLTLVVDDNERGKSTLLAAIVAALYGLSDDRRTHRPLTPLERWRPWEGGEFGVELELECAGERYTITRDFERGTVAVWNGRGQELTAQFLEGRDEHPVGKLLLGLDADEFEKCAFLRQEELDQVVPAEEKDRRVNSLQARLERAADTRAGNSSANEALRVLEEAAAKYTEPLLDTTIKVENAIVRLDNQIGLLATEIHALEHDYHSIRPHIDRLAAVEDEERTELERDRRINAARRAAIEAQARARLERHHASSVERGALEQELAATASCAGVPHDSGAAYTDVVARIEEHARQRVELEAQVAELEVALAALDAELEALAPFEGTEEDATRLLNSAAELRHIDGERTARRMGLDRERGRLTADGFSDEVIARLDMRFGALDAQWRGVLEGQPQVAYELQTESAETQMSLQHTEDDLAAITRARQAYAIPGWVAGAIGTATAGVAVWQWFSSALTVSWVVLAAVAASLLAIGILLRVVVTRVHAAERREARLRRAELLELREALELRRESNQRQIDSLAQALECADATELFSQWHETMRLEFAREPSRRLAGELAELDVQYAAASERAGNPADVEFFDHAAKSIRARTLTLERHVSHTRLLETNLARLAEVRKRLAELEGRAERILETAGILHSDQAWAGLAAEVTRRGNAARRHQSLVEEILPRVQQGILDPDTLQQNEQTVVMFEADAAIERASGMPAAEPLDHPAPSLAELARHSDAVRARLDALHHERSELRMRVEEVQQRYHRELPEKLTEREQGERAVLRARRFKASVDLARDTIQHVALETHRRWAEFLNARVAKLLGSVGTGVEQVRFGEDLDFAVKLRRGQQVSRGKAVRQLSSGARDQLHLAVRLAISEYLSREESLPILIDDCFATSDDGRARSAMNLLIEQFSEHHQVILVTCHRVRAESLATADGDLYQRRVCWIDTRTMRANAPADRGQS